MFSMCFSELLSEKYVLYLKSRSNSSSKFYGCLHNHSKKIVVSSY